MKPKHIAALVTALAAIAAVTVVAVEKRDGKFEDGIYRLKSHGQVVAEVRVIAPAKMQVSKKFKMVVGGGHTTWRPSDASKVVTVRLLTEPGQPVEFTAEEIELDREVNVDPKKNLEKK